MAFLLLFSPAPCPGNCCGVDMRCAEDQFDIVLFADGIYTERGAWLLADAATVGRSVIVLKTKDRS